MSHAHTAAICLALSGASAAGGYCVAPYFTEEEITEENEKQQTEEILEPAAITFNESQELGDLYKPHLLGLTKTSNLSKLVIADLDENKDWWQWSFKVKYLPKRFYKEKLNPLFHNIDIAFNKSEKSLSKVCDDAYKQNKVNYSPAPSNHLLANIGEFCAKGKEPQDISEPKSVVFETAQTDTTSAYKDGVLSIADNAKHLVKPIEGNNDLWWQWAYRNLYLPTLESEVKVSSIFKNLTFWYSKSLSSDKPRSLNHACDEAYKKNKYAFDDENGQLLLIDIARFCSNKPNSTLIPLS